jgi:hypothetical protein
MAIKETASISPFWYIPKSEEGTTTPARFQLRPLKEIEWHDVDMYTDLSGQMRSSSRCVRQVLNYSLMDWENVLGDKGEKIPFDRISRDTNVDRLPFDVLTELYSVVLERSSITYTQKKT